MRDSSRNLATELTFLMSLITNKLNQSTSSLQAVNYVYKGALTVLDERPRQFADRVTASRNADCDRSL